MNKQTTSVSNYDLWLMIAELHHDVLLVRRHELRPYGIAPQQLQVLRTIQELGEDARLSEIAKRVERKADVISRQAAILEYDGLIKKTKDKAKSRLLKLELTKKGLKMLTISRESKSLDSAWSFLTEERRQRLYSELNQMLSKVNESLSNHS